METVYVLFAAERYEGAHVCSITKSLDKAKEWKKLNGHVNTWMRLLQSSSTRIREYAKRKLFYADYLCSYGGWSHRDDPEFVRTWYEEFTIT